VGNVKGLFSEARAGGRDSARTEEQVAESLDDLSIIEKARKGNHAALAEIYQKYRSQMYALCVSRLGDHALADDVVQDAFLRAFKNLDRFDSKRPLWPWLATIAHHRCTDLLRRKSRYCSYEELVEGEDTQNGARTQHQLDSDATIEAVLRKDARDEVERALRRLPARHRRALLLAAVEGWNYADIAWAQQSTVATVRGMISRARAELRRTCRAGLLGAAFVRVRRFRRRITPWRDRIALPSQAAMDFATLISNGSMGILALTLALATGGQLSAPVLPSRSVSPSRPSTSQLAADAHAPNWSANDSTFHEQTTPAALRDEVGGILLPPSHAKPDNTMFTSVTPSPHYSTDRTIYAAGRAPCQGCGTGYVLYASRDGGSTWNLVNNTTFSGESLMLPSGDDLDRRIFAIGTTTGLQVSYDGGKEFTLLTPLGGSAVMSPAFTNGDPTIRISTLAGLWDYREDDNGSAVVSPVPIAEFAQWNSSMAFAEDYRPNGGIFMFARYQLASQDTAPGIYRCSDHMCTSVTLNSSGDSPPRIRVMHETPTPWSTYVFTENAVFRSSDNAASFEPVHVPIGSVGGIEDVAVVSGAEGEPSEIVVAVHGHADRTVPGIYRSYDDGKTWSHTRLPGSGFSDGVRILTVLPSGHILAAGGLSGIACSGDGGVTWHRGCMN
jgi:RNA polymerase sigma-70 factor, ECF subfamily